MEIIYFLKCTYFLNVPIAIFFSKSVNFLSTIFSSIFFYYQTLIFFLCSVLPSASLPSSNSYLNVLCLGLVYNHHSGTFLN